MRFIYAHTEHLSIRERVAHEDGVLTFRTGGEDRHGRADQFLDAADVFDRVGRQIDPGTRAARAFAPTLQRLVNRFDFRLRGHTSGQMVVDFAGAAIGGAKLDLVKAVEHVELGEGDAVDAAHNDRLPYHHRIEPAAPPPPSGNS